MSTLWVKESFHCSFLAFKADLHETEHLRCPTTFNRETTHRERAILTLTRSRMGQKNWAISSVDQTTQNAGPQGIKATATLTHCWMPHTYSMAICSASPSGLRQGKKKSEEQTTLPSFRKGGCISYRDHFRNLHTHTQNEPLLRNELKWKKGKLQAGTALRLHEQHAFTAWFTHKK